MTHRNSKNQLEIQTGVVFEMRLIYNQVLNVQVGSNQFGIIFSSHVTFPQIFYNLPRDSHGMNKHVATNTHLSKYIFFDDSAIILTKIGTIFQLVGNFYGLAFRNMDRVSKWKFGNVQGVIICSLVEYIVVDHEEALSKTTNKQIYDSFQNAFQNLLPKTFKNIIFHRKSILNRSFLFKTHDFFGAPPRPAVFLA